MLNLKCIVFIYLKGASIAMPAGLLEISNNGDYIFRYGKKYLQSQNAEPVDYFNLPLVSEPIFLAKNNLGAIRDSAPDYWGRLVFQKLTDISDPGEIDYLLAPNAARIGNLDFRKSRIDPEPTFDLPEYADLPEIIEVAELLEAGLVLSERQKKMAMLLKIGSSLGGARPKCSVKIDDELWLAKFPSKDDKFSNARIEAAAMSLAAMSGIRIPKLFVKDISGRDVFFIKRFDRDGLHHRKPYISALSLIGIPDNDYRNFSYLRVANQIVWLDD